MKMKVGIVGTGSRGVMSFGQVLSRRDDVEISALCDINQVRLEEASAKLGSSHNKYLSLDEMLGKEKLDCLIITTPDYCHRDNAVKALEKGVSILIDKPLAITVRDCREIIKASEKTGKLAMMGFNLRHDPTLKRFRQILDSGTLGRIFMIENKEFYSGGKTYMARWNRKYELSGGLWIHKGSHDFDVFNWLLGFPKPVKVSAFAGTSVLTPENIPFDYDENEPPGPSCLECRYREKCPDVVMHDSPGWGEKARAEDNYKKDLCIYLSDKNVHDNGFALVEYENGVRASHMECFISSESDRIFNVIGDRGQAEFSLKEKRITVKPRWKGEVVTYELPEVTGGHGGADPALVEHFISVLKGEASATSTLEHGLWSTAIGQAAEISWRENRTVFIKELME